MSELLAEVQSGIDDEENACEKQSRLSGSYLRAYPLCCIGPIMIHLNQGIVNLHVGGGGDLRVTGVDCVNLLPYSLGCDLIGTFDAKPYW